MQKLVLATDCYYYNIWIRKGRVDSDTQIPSWITYLRIIRVPITALLVDGPEG